MATFVSYHGTTYTKQLVALHKDVGVPSDELNDNLSLVNSALVRRYGLKDTASNPRRQVASYSLIGIAILVRDRYPCPNHGVRGEDMRLSEEK
jgi:hypothetical protein